MAKKLALGKGMASLIKSTPNQLLAESLKTEAEETTTAKSKTKTGTKKKVELEHSPLLIDVKTIITNPNQPRKIFKDKEIKELSDSIVENGIIQPLIVKKVDEGFELIAGERRLRAAKLAKIEKVPVVIKKVTDKERMVMSIIENVQRSDLNCVEEALAYYQLMDEFKLTQDEVAKKLGKERSSIANFLRILKLPRYVIDILQRELLSFGHAKVLASVKDTDAVKRFADEAAEKALSVRELEKLVKTKKKVAKEGTNPFFDEKLDTFKQKLEKKTGYHFQLKSGKNGSGQIILKYSNEAEFNDIYEYLLR